LTASKRLGKRILHSLEIGGDQLLYVDVVRPKLNRLICRHAPIAIGCLNAVSDTLSKEALDRLARRLTVVEHVVEILQALRAIRVKRGKEKRPLIAKGRVEATFAQPGRLKNISERCTFVSFAPEHMHGGSECFSCIK